MAEIYVYDVIGKDFFGEGFTAERLRDELAEVDDEESLTVRYNSPGGDVFEAAAMASLLSQRPHDVMIDGLAASAASYLAAFGENVSISDGAMVMIHDPWTLTIGDSAEHQKQIELLEKVGANIARAYVNRTGQTNKAVREAMRAETWYTAEEAKDFGLVDGIVETKAAAYKVPATFGYRNAPERFLSNDGRAEDSESQDLGPEESRRIAAAMRRKLAEARAQFRIHQAR